MKYIEPLWEDYRSRVIPPDAGPVQLLECRRAFIAGAKAMFDFIANNITDAPTGPTEYDLQVIQDIAKEFIQFVEDVENGRA